MKKTIMKKVFSTFSVLAVFALIVACTGKPGERTRFVEETYPIEKFCTEFLETHMDFNTNDITRENTNEEFVKLVLDTLEKNNILKGVPLKLKTIGRNGEHFTAHFQSWIEPYDFKYKAPIEDIYFDIVGTIPDSLSTTLKDDEYYSIDGQFVSRIDVIELMFLLGRSSRAYTNRIAFDADDIFKEKIEVSLGILYYDIKSIEPYRGRNLVEEKY